MEEFWQKIQPQWHPHNPHAAAVASLYFTVFRQDSGFTGLTSRGGHVINLDFRFTSRPKRWRADLNPVSSVVSLFGLLKFDFNSDGIV